ncbi:MAG: histidine kinase [Candidatus Marinimicrobia bacterium]|nr:histidine kinase [Candidatus Neomarinimicrobiota bacterium]
MKLRLVLISLVIIFRIYADNSSIMIPQEIEELKKELTTKNLSNSQKFDFLFQLARSYQTVNFDSSIVYGFKALGQAESNGTYQQIAHSNLFISYIFSEFNETYRALEYATKTLKLAQFQNDDELINRSYATIIRNYLWYTEELDVAKIYLKNWLKFAEQLNDEKVLANVHFNLGIYFVKVKDFTESEKYYLLALDYFEKSDDKQNTANCLNNLGDLKEHEGQLDLALEYNQKALAINLQINDFHGMFINRFNIASIYSKTGKILEFQQILDEEMEKAIKLENHYYLMMIHELYYNYYNETGNYQKALKHYKNYIKESKLMSDNQRSYRMKRLENKYLLEKASDEKKIYELNLKNRTSTLYLVTAVLLLLTVIFITSVIYFVKQRKLEELEIKELKTKSELLALQYKINPHFLFNSLNSISQLIVMKSGHAEDMVQNLSDLLRYTLTFANKDLVPLEEELEAVRQYLDMEKIRFQDRLDYNIESHLDKMHYQIPPMVILPLVENSIKHGISKLIKNGKINIELTKNNNYLIILVRDNGPASDNHDPVEMSKNTGFGHQSIIDRLKITYSGDYKFDIFSCNKEYCVKISIPIMKV